ncbi:MAG TPA: TetR family transcriptional regulator C-terminal domain-containing protein [Methylomirabilota bacterium]|nr:TetR family transcriptional regulator C-terminal domain-containing protein [Methylomirabilota bacterium]
MTPRPRVAPQRREEIVRATIRCLAREGYSGLTMKKLARQAGVSQGILHYYFPNKRAILVAALERVMADLTRRFVREARGARDARQRLRALIEACLSVAVEAREFWVVFVEFWGEMMHDRALLRVNADLYARVRRLIGDIVAEGIRTGQFRRVHPEQAGAVILALADGLSLQLTFDPKAFTVAQAARLGEEAVLRYLAKD